MSRDRRYLVLSGVLIAATVVGMLLLAPSGATVALDVRRSAQRTSPDGVAGWARSLDTLGADVSMRFDSYLRSPPDGEVQVLLEPRVPLGAEEAGVLLSWVRGGGLLVWAPGAGDVLRDSLGVTSRRAFDPEAARVVAHPWTTGLDAGEVRLDLESRHSDPVGIRSALGTPDESWVRLIEILEREASDTLEAITPLAAVAWRPTGQGGVLAIGDAGAMDNERLAASPEAVVGVRAVLDRTTVGGRIVFSEYHQGIRGTGSALSLVWRRLHAHPVGRVLVWGVLWAGLVTWSLGRRFGGPIPQGGAPRRSPIEHVRALAEVYRQTGADRIVANRLVTGAARRAGLDTRFAVEPERALEWWRTHADAPELVERSRRSWERDPPDLRTLSDALDQLVPTSSDR